MAQYQLSMDRLIISQQLKHNRHKIKLHSLLHLLLLVSPMRTLTFLP